MKGNIIDKRTINHLVFEIRKKVFFLLKTVHLSHQKYFRFKKKRVIL